MKYLAITQQNTETEAEINILQLDGSYILNTKNFELEIAASNYYQKCYSEKGRLKLIHQERLHRSQL